MLCGKGVEWEVWEQGAVAACMVQERPGPAQYRGPGNTKVLTVQREGPGLPHLAGLPRIWPCFCLNNCQICHSFPSAAFEERAKAEAPSNKHSAAKQQLALDSAPAS